MERELEIVKTDVGDAEKIAPLAACFRAVLKSYNGIDAAPDLAFAREEIAEFLGKGYPIYAALHNGEAVGYIACRIDAPCVWVEHLYVKDGYRRRGAASALFAKAEELAAAMGEETVFNFVHPVNDGMIAFLRSKGYTVLNMLEIRKPYNGEKPSTVINVGENRFDY